jgi:hypothetical protein
MPTVPIYDHFQAEAGTLPAARINDVQIQDVAGAQATRMGQAFGSLGSAVGEIADKVNQTVAQNAYNQLMAADSKLRYNQPQQNSAEPAGFTWQRGESALKMADGSQTAQYYDQQYQDRIDALGSTLASGAQRKLFLDRANLAKSQFMGDLARHAVSEGYQYAGDTLKQSIATATNGLSEAARNGNTPDQEGSAAQTAMQNLLSNADALATHNGIVDPGQRAGFISHIVGNANAQIISAMNAANNPQAARQWLQAHSDLFDVATRKNLEDQTHDAELTVVSSQTVASLLQQKISQDDGLKFINAHLSGDIGKKTAQDWVVANEQQRQQQAIAATKQMAPIYARMKDALNSQSLIGPDEATQLIEPLRTAAPQQYRLALDLIAHNNHAVHLAQQKNHDHILAVVPAGNDLAHNNLRLRNDVFTNPDLYMMSDTSAQLNELVNKGRISPTDAWDLHTLINAGAKDSAVLSNGKSILDFTTKTMGFAPDSPAAADFYKRVKAEMPSQPGTQIDLGKLMDKVSLDIADERRAAAANASGHSAEVARR